MYYQIEALVIIAVIVYQLTLSTKLYIKITQFKRIFDKPLMVKHGYIEKDKLKNLEKNQNDVVFFEEDTDTSEYPIDEINIKRIAIVETSGSNGEITNIKDAINSYL